MRRRESNRGKGALKIHGQRQRHTDKQTERHIHYEKARETGRQTEIEKQIDTCRDRKTEERQKDIYMRRGRQRYKERPRFFLAFPACMLGSIMPRIIYTDECRRFYIAPIASTLHVIQ